MADTNIKYSDHSISSAFKDHYIVPDYQREYVWTNDQVEQLLSDLLEPFEEDNKKLFDLMKTTYPDAYQCAMKIGRFIKSEYDLECSNDEILYLMIHINRFMERGL